LATTAPALMPAGQSRSYCPAAAPAGRMSRCPVVLLPALHARGERVSIWCGTSVGAITRDWPPWPTSPSRQVDAAVGLWRELRKGDVMAPIIAAVVCARSSADSVTGFGFPGCGSPACWTHPPGGQPDRWIDWDQLAVNAGGDPLRAAA